MKKLNIIGYAPDARVPRQRRVRLWWKIPSLAPNQISEDQISENQKKRFLEHSLTCFFCIMLDFTNIRNMIRSMGGQNESKF